MWILDHPSPPSISIPSPTPLCAHAWILNPYPFYPRPIRLAHILLDSAFAIALLLRTFTQMLLTDIGGLTACGLATWQVVLQWYRFRTKNELRQDDASLFQVSKQSPGAAPSSPPWWTRPIERQPPPALPGTGRCNRERQGQPQGPPKGGFRICGDGQRARAHLRRHEEAPRAHACDVCGGPGSDCCMVRPGQQGKYGASMACSREALR